VEPLCRQKRIALGLSYPKSNCTQCGPIIRPGWTCPERVGPMDASPIGPTVTPSMLARQKKYALGFIFDQARDHVLLIQKARPARQRGKLNGIGGKVEEGETFLQAMIRECWEETGISTEARGLEWQHFATLIGDNYHMEVFALFSHTVLHAIQRADESPHVLSHRTLPESRIMPNLPVLFSLALDERDITKPVLLHDGIPNPA
jgi:8-oxo-dGTP diphosphatase